MSQESSNRPRLIKQGVLLALILLLLPLIAACDAGSTVKKVAGQAGAVIEAAATLEAQANVTPTRTPRVRATPTRTPRTRATATQRAQSVSGLPTIRYQNLPQQAKDTIALIEQGGPFPFERDDITFQNREQILPRERSGYYREYTVITPGSRDRGARRIVAGAEGDLYYSDDHYESFKEVIR
ncbi:MAG TPA: ribonuclease domain-containing protein [Anaerolineae bacterium]|nr:ribonuclease domain-containing protein [Anaerolineae bacterium]